MRINYPIRLALRIRLNST